MRVLLVGGTGPVGTATVPVLLEDGWDVAVAHSGAHESAGPADEVEHLHGSRDELLAPGGPVERWRPDVVVDTFPGGATAARADQLSALAERAAVAQIVAVSSMDVYRYGVEAGMEDGSGLVDLPRDPIPLSEDAPLRTGPYPGGSDAHDNVAMEAALGGAPRISVLRPGAIYGPHPEPHPRVLREWYLVGRVHRGQRRLALPDGGTQLFHRVALERVGLAIDAAIHHAPAGFWACNVVDPHDWTFAGLARLVGARLDWTWAPEHVPWAEGDHPWNVRHPVLCDDTRLREVLAVHAPDPLDATHRTIDWMWERREELAAVPERG
jgi:nucleoside-diphosphate-sugar epimerase